VGLSCSTFVGIEPQPTNPQQTHERSFLDGSPELLRSAAQSLADAGSGDDPEGASQSGDHEIRVLSNFITQAERWLRADEVHHLLNANAMKGGKEHRVAFLPMAGRVLKVADARMLATESLFDYLTDLLLSNDFFDDDFQLLGCYNENERLHIVISQPYIDGIHPEWEELKRGLIRQKLRDPAPRSLSGNFIMDDERLGEVDVFDLHPNNVIQDSSDWLNPIDAHFYFDSRDARITALQKLGILKSIPETLK
jgi:Serine/Threonine/Tyrosine Kinase found in polyvalent proteins